ncbi:hypothetical protein [Lentisalinibacter orientalis]|uniref:hypothetical protein n=1 Tax=Lentisalinibacter orientalis TaxID=2992241 RepID=UPI0038639AB4
MLRRNLLLTLLAALALFAALSGTLDDVSNEQAQAAFKRALVTFAVARTLNGVISVAQGTEVAVEPAGVGVTFGVGQILDPINDLVEQFAGVMLVASTSLGIQNVLLGMTGWWGTTAALVAAVALALAVIWWPSEQARRWDGAAVRLLLILLFLRFAVPLLVLGTNAVFDTFLAAEQEAATLALETTREEIEELNEQAAPPAPESETMMGRLGAMLDESLESMNVKQRLDDLRLRVSNASEHIVNLIVIFVLQTILLPLAFLWIIVQALKALGSRMTRTG